MLSRLVFERPLGDSGEPPDKPFTIELPRRTSRDTEPKLADHRSAGADAIAASARFVNAPVDSSAAIDEVSHDSGIQKIAIHSNIPSIRRSRSAAFATSNSFCMLRSASQAASSSAVITMGSKL
jgi:hypothetical protein